ncbi:bifunctional 3-deoxy-7-phosphoheptulonate synthase/chorismate mutase [Anaerocolumna cellulosilytica]|nr:bifunctional 3-deoxy-7-phosphoheptulonate synthase/chorismate mutase [Anaerocolumna cellulosilytica]MBB5194894.1 3-deoxy-7-phosphoheptulonate synthase [Anaerocolumna cellulosilytica]
MNNKQMIREILGINSPIMIAGPCAVENFDMMEKITDTLVRKGIRAIRAGAFKPRTSPEDFQGLGIEGLKILNQIRKKYNVKIVSEIVDAKYIDIMYENIDVFQVGTRNMYNYELLKELGKTNIPVILKRGMCAKIDEFISAANYILQGGNKNIILCERGIRSFDQSTRNVLDLSCIAIIKSETKFPIIADISHSLGRKDIYLPVAKAVLAAGADGIMVEVHNNPEKALSDSKQQLSLKEFEKFYNELFSSANDADGYL